MKKTALVKLTLFAFSLYGFSVVAAPHIDSGENPVIPVATTSYSGNLSVWGDDQAHQLSDAPTGEFRSIAKGGAYQGLAIRSDGTLVLWGGYLDLAKVDPVPTEFEGDEFIFAALGRTYALAIRPDGTVVGWGNNDFGQLNVPPNVRFEAVAAGNSHSIGLAEDGTLYGWGLNGFGQTNVPAGRFTDIAARVHYTLALRDDGTLFGWGFGPFGIFDQWTPDGQGHFYVAGRKFKGIAAGNVHALAINLYDTVEGWGDNASGQLNFPRWVRFEEVGAGFGYSVGITKYGTLVAWGANSLVDVPDGKFESVAAVAFHAAAIKRRCLLPLFGGLLCDGAN